MKLFYLLGFSKASAYVLYPLIGLYLLLSVYTVLGGWPRGGDRQHIRLLWFLALPTTAFVALWLSGGVFWGILCWLYLGDAGPYYGRLTAGVVATIVSSILLVRLATGRANRPYLRFNAWGAGLCVGLFAAMYFLNFAEGIDGWTARGAAENQFAYLMKGSKYYPSHLPRRIVDETTPVLAAHNGKAFALYIGEGRAAEIRVMPYYRWWWTVSYSRNFPYGEGKLDTREQMQRLRESLSRAAKGKLDRAAALPPVSPSGAVTLVAPRGVESRAVGAGKVRVDWQASVGATSYDVLRRRPETEKEFSTIATDVKGTTYTDDTGESGGILFEYAVVAKAPD